MKIDVSAAGPSEIVSRDAGGLSVALTNLGPDTVYLDTADDVSSATGFPVAAGTGAKGLGVLLVFQIP